MNGTNSSNTSSSQTMDDASDLSIGDLLLDLYKITALLGEGGMGKVYKVFHRGWNTELAVKTAKPSMLDKMGGIDNFEKEAENWVNLGLHNHIVCCYYIRRLEQIPLLFAELVGGGSLKDLIVDKKITTLEHALDIAIQFAWGLHHAHQHDLIHRDVKPDNVMMTESGIAKVTDFGLAIAGAKAGGKGSNEMTAIYSSPEQTNNEILTFKTDMWSWGLSILEIFKGKANWPFGAMASSILEGYLEEEDKKNTLKMPPALVDLLYQCFQSNIDDRPKDMAYVADVVIQIYRDISGKDYPIQKPQTSLDTPDNLNNRAVSLLDLSKNTEADALWQKSLKKQPNHLESLYNTGLLHWRSGQLADDALLRCIQGTQQSSAGDWVHPYLQGLIHLEQDHCESAIASFSTAPPSALDKIELKTALAYANHRIKDDQRRQQTDIFAVEHLSTITSISCDQTGHHILSASQDGTIKLWQTTKSQKTYTQHGNKAVYATCLSQNGQFALSGGADNQAKQWLTDSGALQYGIAHQQPINDVDLSPNQNYALSASQDTTINIWHTNNGQAICLFQQHKAPVLTANFSPNNQFVASGDESGLLLLWKTTSGQVARKIQAHEGALTTLAWLPNNKFILTGGEDTLLKLWDLKTSQCIYQYEAHTQRINHLQLTLNGHYAASVGNDNTLRLWDIRRKRCLCTFEAHENLQSIAINPNQHTLLSGGSEWVVKRWQANLGQPPYHAPMMLTQVIASEAAVAALNAYQQAVATAQQAITDNHYITAFQQISKARSQPGYERGKEAIALWFDLYLHFPKTALNGTWKSKFFTTDATITALNISHKSRYLLSGSSLGLIQLWDLETEQCIKQWQGHPGIISSLQITTDNQYALSAGKDATISLWDLTTDQLIHRFTGHTAPVTSVKFLHNNTMFISSSEDTTLKLWDINSKKILRTYSGHHKFSNNLDITPDDDFMISCGSGLIDEPDNTAKLWQISTGRCVQTLTGHDNWINDVVFSPDGQVAVTASQDRTIRVWKICTGTCLRILTDHQAPVTSVNFSPDGQFLVSSSHDKTVKLWDLYTAKCIHTFTSHTQSVLAVCFSLNSRYIISAGEDKTIQVWMVDWQLEQQTEKSWDWNAKPWLDAFLNQHTPYIQTLPENIDPSITDMEVFFTRQGQATWQQDDLNALYYALACAGMGWITPKGILQQLNILQKKQTAPVRLVQEAFDCPHCAAAYQHSPQCVACDNAID